MDAGTCARPGCGNPLLPGRKLEDVCSYACRGQMKVEAIQGQTGLSGSQNIKQNKALQSLKRRSVGVPTFAKINSCTSRVDSPKKNGWLMEVASPGGAWERWIARVGNWASEPFPLKEAKRAAVAILREWKEAEPRDWIGHLNQIGAAEVDRVALVKARKQSPLDLVGAHTRSTPHVEITAEQRNAIFDAELRFAGNAPGEVLSGDDFQLEFYDDGFPKLPECLRRKPAS